MARLADLRQERLAKLNTDSAMVRSEIRRLETLLASMEKERRSIYRERWGRGTRGGYKDRYVVATAEVRPYLLQAIEESGMSTKRLAGHVGVDEKTFYNIIHGKRKFMYFATADQVLTKLNMPHVQITAVPNPYMKSQDLTSHCET